MAMASVWGVPVSSLFQYVHRFYRNEKEHIRLDYHQRVQLLALFKQVKLGSYSVDKDTETGYFDVVGADRRKAWVALGNLSKEEAQCEIVRLLEGVCPQLKEVVLNDHNAAGKQQMKETIHLEAQELTGQQVANGGEEAVDVNLESEESPSAPAVLSSPGKQEQLSHAALAPAALWCSPNAARNFIHQLQSSPATSAPLTVAPGETVSVQVPTSTQASAIFWEFATEGGGIGFGLGFQWNEGPRSLGKGEGQDLKMHRHSEELLPVTMRDCWEDLVLGSHQYQDMGTYTLNFVNSHSTLPKTVYYRVFYQTTTT